MKTIVIDQLLYNRFSFEHKCLNNIKNIYQHARKCEDQQNLKYILDAAIVSTPEDVTSTPVKKPSSRKSLCLFTNILNVKKKTAKRHVGAAKS